MGTIDVFQLSVEIEEMMDLANTAAAAQTEEEFKRIEEDVIERSRAIRAKVAEWERTCKTSKQRKTRKGR